MPIDPQLPFKTSIKQLFLPKEMYKAPVLDHEAARPPFRTRHALLINPFYPKDPRTSFGKHVLTPSLALTSVAGATPPNWTVEYFDENLLQGRPPFASIPEVVGITVHLTFAQRAYELARWYRERGAIVILGGLHTLSCPDEVAPHSDALAIGDGVQLWPQILRDVEEGKLQRRYASTYEAITGLILPRAGAFFHARRFSPRPV